MKGVVRKQGQTGSKIGRSIRRKTQAWRQGQEQRS